MNFYALIVFVSAFSSINTLAQNDESDPTDKVKKTIDYMLDIIPEKFLVSDVGFVIPDNNFVKGTVNIGEISLSGLKSASIGTVTYNNDTSRIDYEFSFADIHGVADFTIVLNGLFQFNRHVFTLIDLSNIDFVGYGIVSLDPKEISDFSISVSVEKIVADVKGLFSDDEFNKKFNEEISETGAKIVNDILVKITPTISTFFKDIINAVIKITIDH